MQTTTTSRCIPMHPPTDPAKLARLTASMAASGWQGRPLVAYAYCDTHRLLTGSHRYAAARAAGLPVPLEVVPEAAASALTSNIPGGDVAYGDIDDVLALLRGRRGCSAVTHLLREELANEA